MENLINRLKTEAGLTEDQAIRTMEIIKEYMDNEGLHIDWSRFFKGKYEDFTNRAKTAYTERSNEAGNYKNKVADKLDEWVDEAKKNIRDLTQ